MSIRPPFVEKPTDTPDINVPFFKPHLTEKEINDVAETLRSGWLTTGPQVKEFEREFAEAVKAEFAIALNSCTAALHLAVEERMARLAFRFGVVHRRVCIA